MAEQPKKTKISDALRQAILDADVSRYRMARDLGMTEAALSRFVNGVTGLRLSTADAIAEYLGLRLVHDKPARRAKKRTSKGD